MLLTSFIRFPENYLTGDYFRDYLYCTFFFIRAAKETNKENGSLCLFKYLFFLDDHLLIYSIFVGVL